MNFFICKCDKNQCQEEKTGMDLLDIKNLEKTLKDKEKEILRIDNINMIETRNDSDLKENISNDDDELEIIEYPYSKKEDNNKSYFSTKQKKIKNNINNQTKNSPKTNNIKRSKNFFSLKNKLQSKEDLNSSLNNESLIIDDFEYLNDEDTPLNGKNNNKNIKSELLLYKRKIMKKNNNINKKCNSYRASHDKLIKDESLKNKTKKMLTSNKNIDKNKQKYSLSYKKDNKKLSKKLCNLSGTNPSSTKTRNKNYHSLNKTDVHNDNIKTFIDNSFIKNEKENNLTYIYNNKRINKRKVNLKKSKL